MKIAIIGLGFVGSAMQKSFNEKNVDLIVYDKFKNGGIGTRDNCLLSDVCFLCLPTVYDYSKGEYDKTAIFDTCEFLSSNNYTGMVVIKSTVECNSTSSLASRYQNLKFVHNPEFLTARTAFDDFHHQTHIVLGFHSSCSDSNRKDLYAFYHYLYPVAEISVCTCDESEAMKLFCNCFYATKVQFFNELYLLCNKMNIPYNNVKDLMLKNKWINPMHTTVPGPDEKLSYGGLCFPKDTNALLSLMKRLDTPSKVMNAVVKERNEMRDDHDNVNY